MRNKTHSDDSSVFSALESSLSEIDNILEKKNESVFEALESTINSGIKALDMEEKFTFAAFESFIDEAISGLGVEEDNTSVLESLLETAKNTIENKCKSVEDCDKMLEVITTEAAKFNTCMGNMANVGKELRDSIITKEQFKQNIAPAINELKTNCESLGIVVESTSLISDENIATMREFIIGTRNLINEKKLSFGGGVEVDASLEGFISSCESMTIAEEGVNLQTAKMIRGQAVKEARKLVKGARKLAKSRSKDSLEKAIEMLKEAKVLVNEAKKEIDSMPEPMTTWEKLKASFTPIFTLLPSSEVKQVIPTYNYGGNGGMAFTVISETTEDELSQSTASKLKKTLQQILNLLLKNIDKDLSSFEKELTRVSSKANESADTIDGLLFELCLESYTDEDDDDDCCDDEDLDEASFDCYLK